MRAAVGRRRTWTVAVCCPSPLGCSCRSDHLRVDRSPLVLSQPARAVASGSTASSSGTLSLSLQEARGKAVQQGQLTDAAQQLQLQPRSRQAGRQAARSRRQLPGRKARRCSQRQPHVHAPRHAQPRPGALPGPPRHPADAAPASTPPPPDAERVRRAAAAAAERLHLEGIDALVRCRIVLKANGHRPLRLAGLQGRGNGRALVSTARRVPRLACAPGMC